MAEREGPEGLTPIETLSDKHEVHVDQRSHSSWKFNFVGSVGSSILAEEEICMETIWCVRNFARLIFFLLKAISSLVCSFWVVCWRELGR